LNLSKKLEQAAEIGKCVLNVSISTIYLYVKEGDLAIDSSDLLQTVFNQNFSIINLNAAADMFLLLIIFCFPIGV